MAAQLTLVPGGIVSGNSAHGEALVRARDLPMIYLASTQAQDAEKRAKLAAQVARRGSGTNTRDDPLACPAARLDPLAACPFDVVVASNEVTLSGVPETTLARLFTDMPRVDLVTTGLPLTLKGAA